MGRTPHVLVIGDVMTDVVVRPEGPPVPGSDRRAAIRLVPGGSGGNQAAWLAHAGVRATLAARVGVDDLALHAARFRAAGVAAALAGDPDLPSGMLIDLVAPDGERSFLTDRGANMRLCRADLADGLLDGVDLVHVSGYALFEAGPRAAVLDFVAAARARGVPASIDPGSESFLREVGPEAFLAWTAGFAFGFPNESEAAALAGTDDPAAQVATLARHYACVVVKRGAAGAEAGAAGAEAGAVKGAATGTSGSGQGDEQANDARPAAGGHTAPAPGGRVESVPGRWRAAAPATAVIDTTGAGDAFLAGFLEVALAGGGLDAALTAGCALGSFATTLVGGRPPER